VTVIIPRGPAGVKRNPAAACRPAPRTRRGRSRRGGEGGRGGSAVAVDRRSGL